MAFTTQRRPPIVMRRHHRVAPLIDQDESWLCAWSLVLGVGWVLFAVGLVDVVLAWYPARTANAAWEFGAVERSVASLPVMTIGLALVAAAAVLTERRRITGLVAALGLGLGLTIVVVYLLYVADAPVALRMAMPEAAPGIRKSIVRVTFMAVAFSGLFFGIGGSVIRHLRRNPI